MALAPPVTVPLPVAAYAPAQTVSKIARGPQHAKTDTVSAVDPVEKSEASRQSRNQHQHRGLNLDIVV